MDLLMYTLKAPEKSYEKDWFTKLEITDLNYYVQIHKIPYLTKIIRLFVINCIL